MAPERTRGGFVLVTAVLVLALLALATPALVVAAAHAELLAATRLDALRARLAARAAAERALAGWPGAELERAPHGVEVPLLEDALPGEVALAASAERLAPGSWLVRAHGRVGPAEAPRARASAGVRVLLPGGAPEPGVTEAPQPLRLPGWPEPELLAELAQVVLSGRVTPGAEVEGSACDRSVRTNWGAPGRSSHPCADWFPLIYVPGSLTLEAGEGQGILVVEGDLTLGADARFHGIVLLAGRLEAAAGAAIVGALRVAPGGAGASEAVIDDAFALAAALAGAPPLNRPFSPPGRRWLPLF